VIVGLAPEVNVMITFLGAITANFFKS
jgi:hypothetical protein